MVCALVFHYKYMKKSQPCNKRDEQQKLLLQRMIKQPSRVNIEVGTIPWQLPERSAVWGTAEKCEAGKQASLSCIPRKMVWERFSQLDQCFCDALGDRSFAFLVFPFVSRASCSIQRSQWCGAHNKSTHKSGRSTVHLRTQAGKKPMDFLSIEEKKSKNLCSIFT